MIVSWNWLKDYVDLRQEPGVVARRLMMAGLNHEGSQPVGEDLAIDLEVTSNRPDCLGHIGVAREISVLFDVPLRLPAARPREGRERAADATQVRIDCPNLCYRYTARIIRGVKVGPSPPWLAERLRTVGLAVINNVVDVTNYVMLECGQPLHAFDFDRLAGQQIIVREPRPAESLLAIDHRHYELEPGMCVIADRDSAVALGGVMGGAMTEVTPSTTSVLIEAAEFSPLSIRSTARKLGLHSDASYRFERGVDPEGVDWASRRCCELILDLAGGELAAGAVDVGREAPRRRPITLRFSQLPRILGIDVPPDVVRRILSALGLAEQRANHEMLQTVPPSWRRDLTREIDLIEEVARIHGSDRIPEDVPVPMCPSHRSDEERILERVRGVLAAAGFDEALTASVIPREWSDAFSPWTDAQPLVSCTPMKGVLAEAPKDLSPPDCVRRSLLPSLLEARRFNESLLNPVIELYEVARVYLPQDRRLPREQPTLGMVSGQDFLYVKGVVEQLVAAVNAEASVTAEPLRQAMWDACKACELRLGERRLGFLGELSPAGRKHFGLRAPTTCAELDLETLASAARLHPRYVPPSPFPSIRRDLNLVVEESVRWADLMATVRRAAGDELEAVAYLETYRDPQKDGAGKKRLVFSVALRSRERTLTGEEADAIRDRIVAQCGECHGARLLG